MPAGELDPQSLKPFARIGALQGPENPGVHPHDMQEIALFWKKEKKRGKKGRKALRSLINFHPETACILLFQCQRIVGLHLILVGINERLEAASL